MANKDPEIVATSPTPIKEKKKKKKKKSYKLLMKSIMKPKTTEGEKKTKRKSTNGYCKI